MQGIFSRTDPRANAWQDWGRQWLDELRTLGEKYHWQETPSLGAPYQFLSDTVVTIHRQMAIIKELYIEALVNERSPNDPELQRAEQHLHVAFGDASAQLGHRVAPQPTSQPGGMRSTVIVTSPMINVRSGPSMSHEAFRQIKKDEVLAFLGDQGEWFNIKLPDGRVGWVHRSVATKSPGSVSIMDEAKQSDGRPLLAEQGVIPKLEPVVLQTIPIDYLPRPTPDEFKVYAEVEQQLRDLRVGTGGDHHLMEQGIMQRVAAKYGISPALVWNAYLKVQGWEIRESSD
jgi:uncharacterized protein YgiM (DUF1202 family)